MQVLLTGVNGFVGRATAQCLLTAGHRVRGTVRSASQAAIPGVEVFTVGDCGPETAWALALSGVDTVIHLAARVHLMADRATDPLAAFRLVNVAGTEQLAREAVKAGVRRLVFVSSIKVLGEESPTAYQAGAPYNPQDPYAVSKMEAELALRQVASETELEVVIVRPPLVYGPGVKANFLRLLQLVNGGVPLPLASIHNHRSLLSVDNLADALLCCATHPAAAGKTYLVSDGEDVSTPELIRRCAQALGVSARLVPCPVALLRLAGKLTGRYAAVERLSGSLVVDGSAIRQELGWVPPFPMEEGLRETANWFRKCHT